MVNLIRLMTRRYRILIILVLVLTVGISVIMSFISVVSNPKLPEAGFYKAAFDFFGLATPEKFIIVFGVVIIFFYLFRGAYSIILAYITKRYSMDMYTHFSKRLFKINLPVPYKVYVQKNSAELMHSISRETDEIGKITGIQ